MNRYSWPQGCSEEHGWLRTEGTGGGSRRSRVMAATVCHGQEVQWHRDLEKQRDGRQNGSMSKGACHQVR